MSIAIFNPTSGFTSDKFGSSRSGQGLVATARHWAQQVWTELALQRIASPKQPLTRFEEAEQLRAIANDMLQSDPEMAQDLYCAADRHEFAAQV